MWIEAPPTQRKHYYNGLTFNPDPNFNDPSRLNLFTEFPIQPIEGDVSIYTDYLKDIAYNGDNDNYKWGVAWTSQIFQQPHIIMGTMLAIRGSDEGTGKSLYFEILSKLLGRYYVIIDDFEKLKQFNAIAEHALLVHFEEASWAGDFRAEARFRHIISGQQDLYNQKFEKMRMSQNYHRIGISANPGYVVPAGMKARRFGVFDINEAHRNDIEYFAPLHHWLDNEDGYAKIMWFYLHFDISQINLRYPPLTVALFENKIANLKGVRKFVFDLLSSATIPYFEKEGDEYHIYHRDMFTYFLHFQSIIGVKNHVSEDSFGIQFKACFPALDGNGLIQKYPNGRVMSIIESKQNKANDNYYYVMPELDIGRALWNTQWEGEGIYQWEQRNSWGLIELKNLINDPRRPF
jgi:uncharacterized protein DUF5906